MFEKINWPVIGGLLFCAAFWTVVAIIMAMIIGCSTVKISKTTPTGTVWRAEYNRWFNQKIDGFFLDVDPNGTIHTGFASQLSDTQIAFKLGQMSVGIGGGDK